MLALALALTLLAERSPAAAPAAAASDAVARLSVTQALLAQARGEITLVDVRIAGQRQLGHITHDQYMPYTQLETHPADLQGSGRFVFYCSCLADELALSAARVMIAAGRPNVAVLAGGYDAWRAARAPITVAATWEEVFRADTVPVGWGKTPVDSTRCRYLRDTREAARGHASGCIACDADTTWRGSAGFSQRIAAETIHGREVTFSVMIKRDRAAGGGMLWVGSEDADGRFRGMIRTPIDPSLGVQDWAEFSASGVVPSDAVRLDFGVTLEGTGRLWLDDARLTAEASAAFPRVRAVIQNGDFEE